MPYFFCLDSKSMANIYFFPGHQRRSAGEVKQASHTSWNASNPLLFKSVIKEPADYKIWPSKDDMDSG